MGFFRGKKDQPIEEDSPAAGASEDSEAQGQPADAPSDPEAATDVTAGDGTAADVPAADVTAADEPGPRVVPHPEGPWDSEDLPADDERERLDLGGLRVFVPENVELRVDLDQNSQVVAATLVHGDEVMQLGVFAAPRTEPIWAEVRAEISESVTTGGGSVSEVDGTFGIELRARVPTDQPGVFAPARFLGVNGPRWFLRALLSGPLSAEGTDDAVLMEALRAVVVFRGPDAMSPRDGLTLRLPKEAQAHAEAAMAQASAGAGVNGVEDGVAGNDPTGEAPRPVFAAPERGPEITEIG